jgi:hypothetical protein
MGEDFTEFIVAGSVCEAQRARAQHRRLGGSSSLLPGGLLSPKGVNDKEHYCNRDAGVGYIKGRPRIGVPNVQIEKEKIDHVRIKEAIGQITQYASKQQREREIAPRIGPPPSHKQNRHNKEGDNRDYNEESIVAPE